MQLLFKDLQETKAELQETNAEQRETKAALNETKAALQEAKMALQETEAEHRETKVALQETKAALQETKVEQTETKAELRNSKRKLEPLERDEVASIKATRTTQGAHEGSPSLVGSDRSVSGPHDKTLKVWRLVDRSCEKTTLEGHGGAVFCVASIVICSCSAPINILEVYE